MDAVLGHLTVASRRVTSQHPNENQSFLWPPSHRPPRWLYLPPLGHFLRVCASRILLRPESFCTCALAAAFAIRCRPAPRAVCAPWSFCAVSQACSFPAVFGVLGRGPYALSPTRSGQHTRVSTERWKKAQDGGAAQGKKKWPGKTTQGAASAIEGKRKTARGNTLRCSPFGYAPPGARTFLGLLCACSRLRRSFWSKNSCCCSCLRVSCAFTLAARAALGAAPGWSVSACSSALRSSWPLGFLLLAASPPWLSWMRSRVNEQRCLT